MTGRSPSFRTYRILILALACVLFGSLAFRSAATEQPLSLMELVRATTQNELNDDSHSHLFAWMERKKQAHDILVERDVATPQGTLSRVLLINGKQLTPAQQREEEQRERKMRDPAQMRRRLKDQHEDDERTSKMLSVIPDAFDFQLLGSSIAPNGHKLVRVKFTARPGFNPPTRESAVFTGMEGEMLIDENARHLMKIDGTLFKEVNFGWGILGKLYKGGRFFVEKTEISPNHWDTTKMVLHFEGKVLMVKSLHIDEEETDWDFQSVPPMSVEQAVNFLAHDQSSQSAGLSPP